MSQRKFARLIKKVNWYPPLLGAGIRVQSHNQDFTRFDVQLRPKWYTRNLFGTHFGGSLFAMSDPFFVFIVTMNLGSNYIVWDQSAAIDFLKPAKGIISGVFEIPREHLLQMQQEVDEIGKKTFPFEVDLTDASGVAVAHVRKEVYVRRKTARASSSSVKR